MDLHIFGIFLTSILINVVNSISNCSRVSISNHEGVITSPNYPGRYPDFTSCSWYINIPRNYTLSISIVDLSIEADRLKDCDSKPKDVDRNSLCCHSNWLSVPLLHSSHVLCGNIPPPTFELPDSLKIASFKFHSSKNLNGGRGFKLKYAVVPKASVRCNEFEFLCDNNAQCIDGTQQCNGIDDCDDQSDEKNCALKCTSRSLSSCPEAPYICYNASIGGCARQAACSLSSEAEWTPCKDNRGCFRQEKLCDKTIDCDDQSDEAECQPVTQPSTDAGIFFLCDNWKWVQTLRVCDGNDDCGDHSDEDGCIKPSLETAIILGCLSCSLLFILLASYIFHAHHRGGTHQTSTGPPLRPLLNNQPYIMPFREPPPPYPMDPPPSRRRNRRQRRHPRPPTTPPPPAPVSAALDELSESPPREQAAACAWKLPEDQQEGTTSTTD